MEKPKKIPLWNEEGLSNEEDEEESRPESCLKLPCDKCHKILSEPGALLFEPPDKNGMCKKIHICKECYNRVCYVQGIDQLSMRKF